MPKAKKTPERIDDTQLDNARGGGLLVPAVQKVEAEETTSSESSRVAGTEVWFDVDRTAG